MTYGEEECVKCSVQIEQRCCTNLPTSGTIWHISVYFWYLPRKYERTIRIVHLIIRRRYIRIDLCPLACLILSMADRLSVVGHCLEYYHSEHCIVRCPCPSHHGSRLRTHIPVDLIVPRFLLLGDVEQSFPTKVFRDIPNISRFLYLGRHVYR